MHYCPNCSAFQLDTKAPNCPKCGFDLETARKKRYDVMVERAKEKEEVLRFESSSPCPFCGSPTKAVNIEVQHAVEGEKIPIKGLRLMGGEIEKKATTLILIEGKGRECSEGHHIALKWTSREMPICPMCFSKLSPYGGSILSCSGCSKHYPTHSFISRPHVEALRAEGWEEAQG